MVKHYVEFVYPGLIVSESSVEEIAERDVKKVEMPDNCFGFRFFDKNTAEINGETITGDRKNVSGWYYKGEKLTLDEVKSSLGNDRTYATLISNMEFNGYNAVVKTCFGQFVPFQNNDTII